MRLLRTTAVTTTALLIGALAPSGDAQTVRKESGERQSVRVRRQDATTPVREIKASVMSAREEEGVVRLWLALRDASYEPVRGLEPRHLRIVERIGGKTRVVPVEDIDFSQRGADFPLVVSLVRDVSSSMTDADLVKANAAIGGFIAAMAESDEANLIDFGTSVTRRHPFSRNKASLLNALGARSEYGATALCDALWEALNDLDAYSAAHEAMRVCLLFTDGAENASRTTFDEITRRAQRDSVPIFGVGVGRDLDERSMKTLAETTRGAFFKASDMDDLGGIYARIDRYLAGGVLVSFPTRAGKSDTIVVDAEVHYESAAGMVRSVATAPVRRVAR